MGRRRIGISLELFQEMCTVGYKAVSIECMTGLPAGARYVGQMMGNDCVYVIYEHPDWPEAVLLTDENIPLLDVEIRKRSGGGRMLVYKDRGVIHKVAFTQGFVSTDWPCDGTIHWRFVEPLEFEVQELT